MKKLLCILVALLPLTVLNVACAQDEAEEGVTIEEQYEEAAPDTDETTEEMQADEAEAEEVESNEEQAEVAQ